MSIRMRHTKGHTGNRRSHHALVAGAVVVDKETGKLSLPHRLNEETGMYRGMQIFTPKTKAMKAEKVKGPKTDVPHDHAAHDHVDHANADAKAAKGVKGKVATGGRPKARSGFGGGA